MIGAADFQSGKGERDENFPVASRLIAPRHRKPILAFYRFARAADDIADHPKLSEAEKVRLLDGLERTLLSQGGGDREALPLRAALSERGLGPRHALDLLTAFRQDVTQRRYADWDDLMGYCGYSAMPVGRFVLDVHGEDQTAWGPSDALCAALQVINHMQDCGKDYRALDRVYMPLDALAAHGARVEDLGAPAASPELRACLKSLAVRTAGIMPDAAKLPLSVRNPRLAVETGVIVAAANRLLSLLLARDPLSQRAHLTKPGFLGAAIRGTAGALWGRMRRTPPPLAVKRGQTR